MRSIRHVLAPAVLLAALLSACSDATTPNMGQPATPANVTTLDLEQYIDQQIALLYDKGFATSVQARWNTVKRKKATNFDVAAKDFAALADWIDKKVASIQAPPGESQLEASVRLALNMSHWLYGTSDTPVETVGQDVAVEVVPAGQPATVTVPSEHAGVDFGPQNEDRVIIISEAEFPGHCNGPLVTARCQYPLFYRFDSFPHEKLVGRGRFAICLVTTGERRPLEYPDDEVHGEVHRRIRLAHELPEDPANYSEGGTQEGQIEMLQLATDQKGITRCDRESHVGMGPVEKTFHNVMHFAGRILSPKNALAYDQGPEHFGDFFSHFNGVDAGSQPDAAVVSVSAPASGFAGDQISVTYSVENRSRRSGGHATAMSRASSAQLHLFNAAGEAVAPLGAPDAILPMRPDDPEQSFTKTVTLPSSVPLDASYHVGAVVDDAGAFSEVDLENNTGKAAAATLVKRKRAELQFVGGFTLSPSTVAPGGQVTTSAWTVRNTGNAASGPFQAQFYLVPAEGDASPLGDPLSLGDLAPETEAEQPSVTLTIGSAAAPGTYTVELRLDPANTVLEFDENNNVTSEPLTVHNPEQPIALNLTTVEKLPNGTQHFFVTSGSPGPYTWSVHDVDGGTPSHGTITTNADFSADYRAPGTVPTPATFDVCARRTVSPTNRACASVTIKPVPSSGADVVVFNDLNMFDNTGAGNANNLQLFRNLVNYTATGPRATANVVWQHNGHAGDCASWGCGWQTFQNTMRGQGFTVTIVNDVTGPLTAIPANVKVIILALPRANYTNAEINGMKQFSAEGGRIVFVGEWDSYYGIGIGVENDFLTKMGAVMRNTGGAVDCGFNDLPGSVLRPHQVTTGMAGIRVACASVVQPGPNDYPFFYDRSNTRVLGAVAKVDLTPLPMAFIANVQASNAVSADTPVVETNEERARRAAGIVSDVQASVKPPEPQRTKTTAPPRQ